MKINSNIKFKEVELTEIPASARVRSINARVIVDYRN